MFILLDSRNSRKIVSPLSIADALRRLPEGLLYADQAGHVIMANDAMRHYLAVLGVEGPPTKISDIWDQLNEKNRNEHEANVPQKYMSKPGIWLLLRIGENEVRLFSLESVDLSARQTVFSSNLSSSMMLTPAKAARATFGNAPATRIIAYDVKEEIEILDEIEETNASLTVLQHDLESSIEGIKAAAENEALLRMRRRVHDVIGQKLSMLHRSLEGGEISNEKIEQLKPLLNSILEDLSEDTTMSAEDEVNATITAFALANVEIRLEGQLPDNAQHAKIYADAIRETATNAVRHGGARRIDALIGEDFIEISNDGLPANESAAEGIGLSSIRHTVEAAGGTLTVTGKPFSVRIEF